MVFEADHITKDDDHHHGDKDVDVEDVSHDLNVPGRVVLNLWRIIRHKVNFIC